MPLAEFLPANLFAAFLVFCRLGAALMLLPGFGEFYVLQRYRLLLALVLSLLVTPLVAAQLPALPSSVGMLAAAVLAELTIGAFIGTIARVLVAALDIAGTVVSVQLGLSQAVVFNPAAAATQSPVIAGFYSLMGIVLIFATDLHHLMLRAIFDSYSVFEPGVLPPVGDLSDVMTRIVATSFRLGIEMAAPFIVLGVVFFVALGLIGRLVPQLQILFVTQPIQIIGGLAVVGFVLAAGMRLFLGAFADALGSVGG